jgi:hypothetical protein
MPLTTENLVLLQSNRLDDTSDGGGMMTGTALQSGRANNLFPDVSHLDKATGRVSLRKVFAGVASDDNQPFYGAHVILQNDASDPLIDVCLLRANAWAETRADIQGRMQGTGAAGAGGDIGDWIYCMAFGATYPRGALVITVAIFDADSSREKYTAQFVGRSFYLSTRSGLKTERVEVARVVTFVRAPNPGGSTYYSAVQLELKSPLQNEHTGPATWTESNAGTGAFSGISAVAGLEWLPVSADSLGVGWTVVIDADIAANATSLKLRRGVALQNGRPPALSAPPRLGKISIHRFSYTAMDLVFVQTISASTSVTRSSGYDEGTWFDEALVTVDPLQFALPLKSKQGYATVATATEVLSQALPVNQGSQRGDGFRAVGVATLTTAAAAGEKKLLIDRMAASICPPSYLGFDAAIVGLDLDKMPPSGRVDLWRAGDVIVLHDTAVTSVAAPVAGGTTATRSGLSAVVVEDAAGREVYSDRYSVDLATGVLTWASPLNLVGFLGPYSVRHTRDEMALVSVVDTAAASLSLAVPLQKAWPANAQVSGSLLLGDLVAGFSPPFEQGAWTGEWSNAVIGQAIAAQYNTAQYPLTLTNRGAIAERWRIDFTNATTVKIIGESVGVVAEGVSINSDVAPLNPATGTPYFSIDRRGWGSGWNAGNQLRFNTSAGKSPFWLSRATLQGVVGPATDSVRIQLRGDTDV